MNEFEKYIKENREAFDDIEKVRTDIIWQEVIKDVQPKKFNRAIWFVGAICIGLLSVGYYFFNLGIQDHEKDIPTKIMAAIEAQTDSYQQLIQQKSTEVNLEQLDREEYAELLNELKSIETRYSELLDQLNQNGNLEDVIQGLISYHERKLRILDLIAKEIDYRKLEKMKSYEMYM